MTRRSSTPIRPQRRSLLVIAIVILAAIGLAFSFIPGVLAPPVPLSCPYGEVILNGAPQCLPSQGP